MSLKGTSFIRTILKDDNNVKGLIDIPLHNAGDFDAITHEWVHVLMTVTPTSMSYHLNGKFIEDKDYAVFLHTDPWTKSGTSTFWPKPSKLQRKFTSFNLATDTFLGGRADRNKDRHFPGSLAMLTIYDQALPKSMAKSLFNFEEPELPDCKGVYGGKNRRDKCGVYGATFSPSLFPPSLFPPSLCAS